MPEKISIRHFLLQLGITYKRHFLMLFVVAFVAYLLPNAISLFLEGQSLPLSVAGLILQIVAWVIVLFYTCSLAEDPEGFSPDPLGVLRESFSRFYLVTASVVLRLGAVAIGLLAFLLPGIFIYIITATAGPAAVAGNNPLEALTYSAKITKGNRWRIAAIFAVLISLFLLFYLLIVLSLAALIGGVSQEDTSSPTFLALPLLLITATTPLVALCEAMLLRRLDT